MPTQAELDALQVLTDAAAAAPKDASVDGRSASAHSLKDLIELEKWRANQLAGSPEASPTGIGVKFFNTTPPGAV